jgi:serine/threonine-protein kinase
VDAAVTDSLLGLSAGNYRITAKIGEGGMARVYRAVHPEIGREVAVKVLSLDLVGADEVVRRFKIEAQTVNRIRHPNIVQIFDFGTLADGRPFYLMELLEGESLATRIKRGALSVVEAIALMDPVLDALEAAHRASVVHRDLKPDNVYLQRLAGRIEVKLLDFGIAKLLDAHQTQQTRSGVLMGTPAYMAPEQAAGRMNEIGPRTDIYAVGVMLYEMLANTPPFTSTNLGALLLEHLQTIPPTLSERKVAGIPEALSTLVATCLAKDPAQRPPSAAILREKLRAFAPAQRIAETLLAEAGPTGQAAPIAATMAAPSAQSPSFGPSFGTTSLSGAASEVIPTAKTTASAGGGKRIAIALGALLAVGAVIAVVALRGRGEPAQASPPGSPGSAASPAKTLGTVPVVATMPDAAPRSPDAATSEKVAAENAGKKSDKNDAVSRLAELRRLFESGAIKKREYEKRRKEILDAM